MNKDNNVFQRISEIINKGKTGSLLLPTNPSFDAVAAATALYLGLNKGGKTITLACDTEIKHNLTGVDKIQKNLVASGDSLVISFPYIEGGIDKVDYNIKGDFFNLIITPRPGYQKLDPSQVKYSYTGGAVDFLITIDVPSLNSLGNLYHENQKLFVGCDIINIDRHLTNAHFGTVNFVNKTSSSVSELILTLLKNLNIEIDPDMATNLYAGISAATNNFTSYSVTAETFENAAQLLRAGAIKKTFRKPEKQFSPSFPIKETQNIKPIEVVEKETQPEQNTPQDWLKPKIFRGGNLI